MRQSGLEKRDGFVCYRVKEFAVKYALMGISFLFLAWLGTFYLML
ncbi:membrane protein YpdK [Erwinia sp. CGal63]